MPPIDRNTLRQLISAEARVQGVDPHLALTIAFDGERTSGDNAAISPKGARGIFQLMPGTAKELNVDPDDPTQNIRGGVSYLKKLNQMFPGDLSRIAAAYNAGPGAVTRHGGVPPTEETQGYVQRVLAGYKNETSLNLPTVSTNPRPTLNYTASLQAQIAGRDPRQPVIDLGLEIMGKTRADFGERFNDPTFVDNFYRATMQKAESVNPQLNITNPNQYVGTLKKLASEAATARTPQVQGPPAPEVPEMTAGQYLKDAGNALIQTARGIVVDPAINVIDTAKDLAAFANRTIMPRGLMLGPFGIQKRTPEMEAAIAGARPGQTLNELVDGLLGKPTTPGAEVARKLASFVSPFLGISKGLQAATGMGKTAAGVVSGAIANTAFIDPDSPALSEMIYNLSMTLNPQDPEQLRSKIARFVAGDDSQLPDIQRLTGRAINTVEGVLVDVVVSGILPFLRANKATKDALVKEVDALPFNPAATGQAANEFELTAKVAPDLPPSATPGVKGAMSREQALTEAAGARASKAASIVTDDVRIIDDLAEGEVRAVVAPELPPSAQPGVKGVASKAQAAQMAEETRASRAASTVVEQVEPLVEGEARAIVTPELPSRATPGFHMGWTRPQTVKQVDDILENVKAVGDGAEVRPMTLTDQAPDLTPQQALSEAERVLSLQAGADVVAETFTKMDAIIANLKAQMADPTNQKIALAIALKGTIGGLISDALIDPFEASAATETSDKNTRSLANFLIGAGIVAAGAGAIQIARKLRASAGAAAQNTIDLNLAPPTRVAGPGHQFVRTRKPSPAAEAARVTGAIDPERADWSTVVTFKDGRQADIRLDHVRDAEDYQETIRQFQAMLPDDAARIQDMMPIPIDDTMRLAQETAMDPKALDILKRMSTPQQYSRDVATTYFMAKASQRTVEQLSLRIAAGETGLGDEWLRQVALLAETGRGLLTGRSDIGRAMNVLRQASDGRLDEYINLAGVMAGSHVKTDQAIKDIALKFAGMTPEGMARTAKEMYKPNRMRALGELFINGLLAVPAGAGKQFLGDVRRIGLEVMSRGLGAAEARTWGIFGQEVPKGTPYIEESLIMLNSLMNNTLLGAKAVNHMGKSENMWQAAWRTLRTGEHQWSGNLSGIERIGGSPMGQWTSDAFGWENRLLEATGVNAAYRSTMDSLGLPHAATVIDAIGNWIRVGGMRLRITADEATQYLIHNMEMDAYAYRAARDAGVTGEEAGQFLRTFHENPPDWAVHEIARQKKVLTYMNELTDERGGFAALRQLVSHMNISHSESAVARIQLPFLRTHMNLLTSVLEHTPGVNLMSPAFRNELTSSDPIIRASAQGKMWTGLALTTFFAYLGSQGIALGPMTTDKNRLEQLKRAGRHPNTIQLFGHSVKMDTSEPLGFLLALGASIGSAASEDVTPEEMDAATSALIVAAELITHAPIIDAMGEIANGLEARKIEGKSLKVGADGVVAESLDSIVLKSLLPPLVFQQLQKIIEPHKQVADKWYDRVLNRTPGLGTGVLETDIMGRPRYVGGGVSGSQVNNFARFMFPIDISANIEDPLDKAMADKGVVIRDPRAVFSYNNVDVPLSKMEVQKMKDYMANPPYGMPLYQALKELTEQDWWKDATPGRDGVAQLEVSRLVDRYRDAARQTLLAESPELRERILEKGKKTGFIPQDQ